MQIIEFIDEQGQPGILEDVLYIPKLRNNLFSSAKAVLEGNLIHSIQRDGVTLKNAQGLTLLKGNLDQMHQF